LFLTRAFSSFPLAGTSKASGALKSKSARHAADSCFFLSIRRFFLVVTTPPYPLATIDRRLVRPKAISRGDAPQELPDKYKEDYLEACLVLADSPKASAALSRRCLQNLLREEAKTTAKDLFDQIQEVLDSGKLPSNLSGKH